MTKKKKEEVDLDELNLDELLLGAVASGRLGRALASLGATLTGREKHDAKLVYLLLKAGREYSARLPVVASIQKSPEKKKYTPSEAIEWFATHYSKEAEPLLKRLEEEYTQQKTVVVYGLKEKRDLTGRVYIENLSRLLEISEDRANVLYNSIIRPHLAKEEEEGRLLSQSMKDKTK